MSIAAINNARLTWDDYLALDDGLRWELINGELFAMSSPTTRHQTICTELTRQFANALRGKTCRPFVSPIDVKLSDDTVLQPDLLVVCNRRQIKHTHIEGAPTLVVEILSDTILRRDHTTKLELYARFGVNECWLVSQSQPAVEQYILADAAYRLANIFNQDARLTSIAIPNLEIDLPQIFESDKSDKSDKSD